MYYRVGGRKHEFPKLDHRGLEIYRNHKSDRTTVVAAKTLQDFELSVFWSAAIFFLVRLK
jgi:hypothetical protein